MISWWIAMIIGAVTLCIGYSLGKLRMIYLMKMAEELADMCSRLLEETDRLQREIEDELKG